MACAGTGAKLTLPRDFFVLTRVAQLTGTGLEDRWKDPLPFFSSNGKRMHELHGTRETLFSLTRRSIGIHGDGVLTADELRFFDNDYTAALEGTRLIEWLPQK